MLTMSGFIPPALLEQVRAANEIVDVIGACLPLKRAGANFVALCPFHREKTPSFNVVPQRQIFHCFGCHKGGDVFTFVRLYENLSFVEAVQRLAERAHIPLEFEGQDGAAQARSAKDTLLQIHEQLTQRWQTALNNDAAGQIARDYLGRRGVAPEAVRLFRLGYAAEAWDDTVNWSRTKGYEAAMMEQAGLIIRRESGQGYYDRFRGRLMFPINDEQGRVIGFSGRVLSGDEKTAKYVNSPETPLFTKGRVIYGLDKSKRALLDSGYAVICEGQLDLIACYTAGVQNVVAPQGTALTGEHCRVLKRYVEEVVLCFDADPAGQNAALRALDDLVASGLAVRVALLPAPHDPDSFIKERGGSAFQDLLRRAPGFFDFLLARLCATHDRATDRGRIAILRGMADALLKTRNAVLTDTYAQKTALQLGVAVDAVRLEFQKTKPPPRPTPVWDVEPAPAEAETPRPSPAELWLLKLLLLDDQLVPWAAAHVQPHWIQHAEVRQVLEHRFRAWTEGTWHGVAALLGEFESASAQRLITEAVSEQRPLVNRAEQVRQVVRTLRDDHYDHESARLLQQLANPGLSDEARVVLLRRQQELRALKKQPLEPLDKEPAAEASGTAGATATDAGLGASSPPDGS
jgi:DNA primase